MGGLWDGVVGGRGRGVVGVGEGVVGGGGGGCRGGGLWRGLWGVGGGGL